MSIEEMTLIRQRIAMSDADLDAMIARVEALDAQGVTGRVRISDVDGSLGAVLTERDAVPVEGAYVVRIASYQPDPCCTYHPGYTPRESLIRALFAQDGDRGKRDVRNLPPPMTDRERWKADRYADKVEADWRRTSR